MSEQPRSEDIGVSRTTGRLRFRERLFSGLGFGYAQVPLPDEAQSSDGALITDITLALGWGERLRMLISGRAHIELVLWADGTPKRMQSISALRVLPPRFS